MLSGARGFLVVISMVTLLLGCGHRRAVVMATFRTSLKGRTEGQKLNAMKAARALDGAVIPSDSTFSFNRRVGSWTREKGFVRAPVSFGGVLVPSWGGGVCQVSTTLYGAALSAGLDISERHHHSIAPSYVPMGLDAAVAYGVADLKLHNPFPFPVQVKFDLDENQLTCQILGLMTPNQEREWKRLKFQLKREIVSASQVRLWRLHYLDNKLIRRELCNESNYMRLQ